MGSEIAIGGDAVRSALTEGDEGSEGAFSWVDARSCELIHGVTSGAGELRCLQHEHEHEPCIGAYSAMENLLDACQELYRRCDERTERELPEGAL